MNHFVLSNGVEMPKIGLGVYKIGDDKQDAIIWALQNGYRHLDTAAFYHNEEMIADAIKKSGIKREDVFITTKLWNSERGPRKTQAAFEESLKRLNTDYVDLYLIHWPAGNYIESWSVLESLYRQGKARAIGVANFEEKHLKKLMSQAEITPMVDQVQTNPFKQQLELHDYLVKNGIQHIGWGPFGQGNQGLLYEPILTEIGAKYGKTTAQVILRWNIERDIGIIPKSINPERLKQNMDILDFTLSTDDMKQIASLDTNKKGFNDPNNRLFLFVTRFIK